MAQRPKLLFVKSRRASFIELDQQLLAERYEVTEIYQPGKFANPLTVLTKVVKADVVVGWWASWHTFLPFTLAWLLRKPSLLIVGGFDTAAEPEFGYGYQLGGVRKHLSRWIMHRARVLMTNSEYSRAEIERNVGIPAAKVSLVYHGIPDGAVEAAAAATADAPAPQIGSGTPTEKRNLALTVGIVDMTNLSRKGLMPFVQAAVRMPETEFVVAGKASPEAQAALQRVAAPNVRLTGWLEDQALDELMGQATVYVQASRHEGFGVSLAEAMLRGCVPVATAAGALPEVVGETGVIISDSDPQTVADGIRLAFERSADPRAGAAARSRILKEFSLAQRREGLYGLLDEFLA